MLSLTHVYFSDGDLNKSRSVSEIVFDRNFYVRVKRIRGWGTPIFGRTRNVWPESVSFPGQKPADGCDISAQKPAGGS